MVNVLWMCIDVVVNILCIIGDSVKFVSYNIYFIFFLSNWHLQACHALKKMHIEVNTYTD